MKYDFDQIIDRTGSNDVKHVAMRRVWRRDDLLPLWVADMDFATPPFIVDAMRRRMEHPIFGYTVLPRDYWPTIIKWIEGHHQWHVEKQWMRFIPGIVKGIGMVTNVLTRPGEKLIIQPPVYHPFYITPEGNGRIVVRNPLIRRDDGYYDMDFDNLEQVCDDKCKVLILSNPHNPAGLVWSRETLIRLADFCYDHHLIVVSDEIHCDMALFGHRHVPFASVSEKAAKISITFGAPSKTFNIAGIVSSYAIVPDETLRNKFFGWIDANEMDAPTIFSSIATMAAYKEGEEWRKELIAYIEKNVEYVEDFCRRYIPQIRPLRPQASFLVWLDCRGLQLAHDDLQSLFVDKAHLALNDGEMFGKGGEGFMRLNVGTPRSILRQAMEQLRVAVEEMTAI